jgi:hypothetical protein
MLGLILVLCSVLILIAVLLWKTAKRNALFFPLACFWIALAVVRIHWALAFLPWLVAVACLINALRARREHLQGNAAGYFFVLAICLLLGVLTAFG